MNSKKNAFTMIELIFVIVVLGILAAIAIPRLAVTRDDAQIVKGRSDVASIRSAIVTERQTRLLRGQSAYINHIDDGTGPLFENNGTAANTILMYGIQPGTGNGHWARGAAADTFTYTVLGQSVTFTYTPATGRFDCDQTATYCSNLVN